MSGMERFMEYFRYNYPGPHTIIAKPDWHSPKIYGAALSASGHRELLDACKFALEIIETHLPELHDGSMALKLREAIAMAKQ